MTPASHRHESDARAIRIKLEAARTRLVMGKPFIGALVLHLPLVESDSEWCESVATDARALYYNATYIERLTLPETQFVLAHAALHCALAHFARRGHRETLRWDLACDHAVNLLLSEEGLSAPAGALADDAFRGLSAEEIYPLIARGASDRTMDRHVYEKSGGQATEATAASSRDAECPGGEPQRVRAGVPGASVMHAAGGRARRPRAPDAAERADLARKWRTRLVAAAQLARRAGSLSATWRDMVEENLRPQLPWRALLARYLWSVVRDDYSFHRPQRREGDAVLPRLSSPVLEVAIALDTSGSIGTGDLAGFAAEINALKGQVRARVTLHACDAALDPDGPWQFEAWEPVELPRRLGGGGGTRFAPVFDWIAEKRAAPDILLYFTDAEGEFPVSAPLYPVVWLVKGAARVPWGSRIQID